CRLCRSRRIAGLSWPVSYVSLGLPSHDGSLRAICPCKLPPMQSAQFELHADMELRHWWFVARRQILSQVVAAVLPPSRKTTIIDVGCGTGANLAGLARDYNCVGIDTSAQAVRLAARRFPDIRFIHGQAPADLDGVLEQAGMVLLMDVL